MNFYLAFNNWLENHLPLFLGFLYSVLSIMLLMFISALVHVLKGTQFRFVIFLNVAIIISIITYFFYTYTANKGFHYAFWKFLSFANFQIYHWVLSFTYYQRAQALTYMIKKQRVPANKRIVDRIFFWAVMLFGILSSIWVFFPDNGTATTFKPFYLMNAAVLLLSSIVMAMALMKIKKILIKQGLGDQLSLKRMVVHALVFLLYVLVFIFVNFMEWWDDINIAQDYVSWFLCTIFGFCSFLCLFYVLWNLGTKKVTATTSQKQDQEIQHSDAANSEDDLETQENFNRYSNRSYNETEQLTQITELQSIVKLAREGNVQRDTFETRIWLQFITESKSNKLSFSQQSLNSRLVASADAAVLTNRSARMY